MNDKQQKCNFFKAIDDNDSETNDHEAWNW